MKLSIEQVRHVARLARLALTAREEERYAVHLGAILAYVEELEQVDTSNIPPTAHAAELPNLMREDVVQPSLPVELAVRNAPERADSSIVVPKIIE
jgi:aspartyl-tRNA(Asn)/glutamyl-tRNA(Gln) amidotransferase subunit C